MRKALAAMRLVAERLREGREASVSAWGLVV